MPIFKQLLFIASTLLLLSACGGGSDGCSSSDGRPLDTTTDATENCANTSAPANIAITYPNVAAIEHLLDSEGKATGVYSLAGSVIVTDRNGNAVADDTLIQLDVIDSILAQGTIGAGDSITATSFTDSNSTLSNDSGIGVADFTLAHVRKDGASLFIDNQSMVMITNAADRQDQARFVDSIIGNTITVTSPYNSTYPNTIYPSGTTTYIVGKTTVGMKILGIDNETGLKTEGFAKTKNGIASFRLEYPANEGTISVGCVGVPAIDTRFPTFNTRDTWVRATAGSDEITVVNDDGCFEHILPESFAPNDISAQTGATFALKLQDAEGVGIPFITVAPFTSEVLDPSVIAATGSLCVTNGVGVCIVTVTGDETDTITYETPGVDGTNAEIVIVN